MEQLRKVSIGSSELLFMVRPDLIKSRELDLQLIPEISKVRLAFYQKDLEVLLSETKSWQKLGAEVWLNPIDLPGYSTKQVTELIRVSNDLDIKCFSIVDTYGTLETSTLNNLLVQLEKDLSISTSIGLHSHDNLQMSLSLAAQFAKSTKSERDYVIDASLLGMGRAPGNLKLELIAALLNRSYGSNYNLEKILATLEEIIYPIYQMKPWGYNVVYAYGSFVGIDRSYAESLIDNKGMTLVEKIRVINLIGQRDKSSRTFSQEILDELIDTVKGSGW
jgi:4-hydroxy 2-oxovalerate aldolase